MYCLYALKTYHVIVWHQPLYFSWNNVLCSAHAHRAVTRWFTDTYQQGMYQVQSLMVSNQHITSHDPLNFINITFNALVKVTRSHFYLDDWFSALLFIFKDLKLVRRYRAEFAAFLYGQTWHIFHVIFSKQTDADVDTSIYNYVNQLCL